MSRAKKKPLRHRLRARSPTSQSRAPRSTKAILAGLAAIPIALLALLILRPPGHTHGPAEPLGRALLGGTGGGRAASSVARQGTPTGADLPSLADVRHRAARPREAVRAAYEFAARHPEILSYIPCFCGCQRKGHRSNHDCFVASRDEQGHVTWDAHAMT